MKIYIETPRLILREWTEEDFPVFARMNDDDRVMEFFLQKLTEEQSRDFYNRIINEFKDFGYGLYAVERKEDQEVLGYVGFHNITFDVDFAPGVEIGWRLIYDAWGKGYATEAAKVCLEYAKKELGMHEIYSFTTVANKRSEEVMKRIGMHKVKEFDHPLVPDNHPFKPHVLYKITL